MKRGAMLVVWALSIFPDYMMKKILFAFLGIAIATLIAWGGLLLHGAIYLSPGDSQWDRDPGAARLFFRLWAAISVLGGVIGWWWARRRLSCPRG